MALRRLVVSGGLISLFFVICQSCAQSHSTAKIRENEVTPGAWQLEAYLPLLRGKHVGLVVNHTSLVRNTHLVDTLIASGVDIKALFAPEHGLRGLADAGAHISDGVDQKTGIRVISLYGSKKKPDVADLVGIDVMVFDIQDVGVRFYTYISTLHYIMEACAVQRIPLIVLDRPNPNGHYIDGPVLDTARFRTFVGMHPIPVVYGLTIGELAGMINGEGWIKPACTLMVIPCLHYDHNTMFDLPVRPSPNLPDFRSVLLYPGICFFEGTVMSLGRGTSKPFQVVGHPDYPDRTFSFTPAPVPGAMDPPLKNRLCYGVDLSHTDIDSLFNAKQMDIRTLLGMYASMDKTSFFNKKWFDTLAGGTSFREAIEAGRTEEEIRQAWEKDLDAFKERRTPYLLY